MGGAPTKHLLPTPCGMRRWSGLHSKPLPGGGPSPERSLRRPAAPLPGLYAVGWQLAGCTLFHWAHPNGMGIEGVVARPASHHRLASLNSLPRDMHSAVALRGAWCKGLSLLRAAGPLMAPLQVF